MAEIFTYEKKALVMTSSEHVIFCGYINYFWSYDILNEVGVFRTSGQKREVLEPILGGHATQSAAIQ